MSDKLIPETPTPEPGLVAQLPRRVAHAVHALLFATKDLNMPPTSAEIVIYDEESSSAQETAAALRQAQKLGLAAFTGRYWVAAEAARSRVREFEERYLADTGNEDDA